MSDPGLDFARMGEDSDEVSPGDFAAAINGYRSVFDHLVATRAAAGGELDAADAEHA